MTTFPDQKLKSVWIKVKKTTEGQVIQDIHIKRKIRGKASDYRHLGAHVKRRKRIDHEILNYHNYNMKKILLLIRLQCKVFLWVPVSGKGRRGWAIQEQTHSIHIKQRVA